MRPAWYKLLAICAGLAVCTACDRQDGAAARGPRQEGAGDFVTPAAVTPEYSFDEACRRQYPQIVDFLQQFLETCLAGDYAGYRRLCSRRREPETRERFEAVYHAIRSLHIESIQPLEGVGTAEPVYRVVCAAEFHPESRVRLRRKSNRVAILVIREQEQWRILPAPSEWQPEREEEAYSATASTPASVPSYPWDRDDGE